MPFSSVLRHDPHKNTPSAGNKAERVFVAAFFGCRDFYVICQMYLQPEKAAKQPEKAAKAPYFVKINTVMAESPAPRITARSFSISSSPFLTC